MRAPGLYPDVPEREYLTDPALSASGAKKILRSPRKFRYHQTHPEFKDVFDFGSAAHELVLGAGPGIVVIPATGRTKAEQTAHREAKEAARAEGKTPVTQADFDVIRAMADEISGHANASALLSDGRPEVSAWALDHPTGVMRRCRFDFLTDELVVDFKTTRSADPDVFLLEAVKYGYHQQHAWYLDVAADLGHPALGFGFIAQEKEPPYEVTVIELPDDLVEVGRAMNRRALERFRDCTESGVWPSYVPDTEVARPLAPAWALRETLGETA